MNTQSQQSSHNHGNHDVRVGERVLLLMFRARITQTALARKLGMTQAGLSKKIHGERKWTLDDLYAIAGALGVGVTELLGETQKPPTSPKTDGGNVGPEGLEPPTLSVITRDSHDIAPERDQLANVLPFPQKKRA